MKKTAFISVSIITFFICVNVTAQKTIAEATLTYNTIIYTGNNSTHIDGAYNIVYLKGKNMRTDMVSPLGKEITIFNSKQDNAVILKEFSGQKLMITLNKENWKTKNKMFSDIKFELTGESKIIEGYNTKKAIAKLADGRTFEVYYSPDFTLANKYYDATFSNLPGLAIQYEIESGKMKFKYTLAKISYDPVPVSIFDFPTSGYRVMTYEENQQLKKGN
ncbi:MAG TPA: hypothetical protein PK987_00420 [Ferruginibacter sp.]|nr:hypothetical protein [Ferruginibacter sp.]